MAQVPQARPLRLATYNVEWFNALFTDTGRMLDDAGPSARHGVTRDAQLAALRVVFSALDADGIMVIEAPDTGTHRSTVRALENFAASAGIRARRAVTGFPSETEQEIAFLYDPDRLEVAHDPKGRPGAHRGQEGGPRFDGTFRYDLDADGVSETIRFSKPPLELAVRDGDRTLRLIGVHAKSKVPHAVDDPAAFTRISIENRRKQLAQCLWLRERVNAHLAAGDSVIVLGDLNDGPGLDEYEKLFGHSGVEVVLGLDSDPHLRLTDPHATMALAQPLGVTPTTARFWLAPEHRYFEALIDFIMVSPDLAARHPDWRIWHPANDPAVLGIEGLAQAILTASDHFPVTLDLPRPVETDAPHPHLRAMMTRAACLAPLLLSATLALPAAAQETAPAPEDEGPSLMERGLSMFFDGFKQEMEPALGEMAKALEQLGPTIAPALEQLMALVDDMTNYEAPVMLENGDIIIRRKPDAPKVEPPADQGVEL